MTVIEKDAIAKLSRSLLQRQRDQVAEAALRKRVLIGEETVIGIKPDARSAFHRFGQQVSAELRASVAGIACSKNSQMCPPLPERDRSRAAARFQPTTRFQHRLGILLPLRFVQVGREEKAGFIPQQRVNAHDEVPPGVIAAGKMPANDLVRDGQENADCGQAAHLILGFSHKPGAHSLPQAGEYPDLPVLRFSKRRG